jgi:hypothetical protein
MSERLKNFLSEIAVDAAKLGRYLENPDAAMKEAGLDADESAALKSGDPAKVYASLSGQAATTPPAPRQTSPPVTIIYGVQPQANIIYAPPQANIIYATQPQANIIYAAQPQQNIIYAAPPQPDVEPTSQPPQAKGAAAGS